MSSSIAFGSFSLCTTTSFPVCDLLPFQPTCVPTPLAGIRNIGELILCALTIVSVLYFLIRCKMKKSAVGRLEMTIFMSWVLVAVIAELVLGGIGATGTSLKYVGAVQIGSTAAAFIALSLNGFVGYQWLDDGTSISLLGVFGTSLLYGIAVSYLAADASLQINFNTSPSTPVNVPLFVLYFIVPVLCVVIYTAAQTVLVMKYLRSRHPLGLLAGAFLAFVLAVMTALFISSLMCTGTNSAVDGRFLITFWIVIAVWWVFRFWDSITEDSLDDFDV